MKNPDAILVLTIILGRSTAGTLPKHFILNLRTCTVSSITFFVKILIIVKHIIKLIFSNLIKSIVRSKHNSGKSRIANSNLIFKYKFLLEIIA
jgi:hypothetical protein